MVDRQFTLVEVHLDGETAFSPSLSIGGSDAEGDDEEDGSGEDADADADGRDGGLRSVVVSVVVLAVLALALRRVFGTGGE